MNNEEWMMLLERYYTAWGQCHVMYERWARKYGFSSNEILVLYSLHHADNGCAQKQISEKWFIPKQTINMILKKFAKLGYVELIPDGGDKRSKTVLLTPLGKETAG